MPSQTGKGDRGTQGIGLISTDEVRLYGFQLARNRVIGQNVLVINPSHDWD